MAFDDALHRLVEDMFAVMHAAGFRDVVVEHRSITAADYERYNPNDVGGDIPVRCPLRPG